MKQNLLIISASIKSHLLPTLYLSNLLKEQYNIYYTVYDKSLKEIVEINNYTPIVIDDLIVGVGLEERFLVTNKKNNFINLIRSIYTNELYKRRVKTYKKIIDDIKPSIILIDIFCSTEILLIWSVTKKAKINFYNPMLSTYKIDNIPTVNKGDWMENIADENHKSSTRSISKFIYDTLRKYQWRQLIKHADIPINNNIIETEFTRIFSNINELILAPIESEFSEKVKKENQYYIGLSVDLNRKDINIDERFEVEWNDILSKNKNIIYCSFGTFYSGSDKYLITFLQNIIESIIKIKDIILICSVNKLVVETLKSKKLSSNVYLYNKVPQLKVLRETHLYITHGGLGSIKEGIYNKVPMLVYPLDPRHDQKGNAFKIEYHGLGLRGIFNTETKKDMIKKINSLLNDNIYKENLNSFNTKIIDSLYNKEEINEILNK